MGHVDEPRNTRTLPTGAWRLVRHFVHMPHDPIMVLGYGAFSAVDADGNALAGGKYEVVAVDVLHESWVDQIAAVAA